MSALLIIRFYFWSNILTESFLKSITVYLFLIVSLDSSKGTPHKILIETFFRDSFIPKNKKVSLFQ